MKKNRNLGFVILACVLATTSVSAQIKKETAQKPVSERVVIVNPDTIKPTEPAKPTTPATTPTNEDLLESIQRDIQQKTVTQPENTGQKPTTQPENTGKKPTVYVESPEPALIQYVPRPPKIRKVRPFYHHEVQLEAGAFLNQLFRVFGLVKNGEPYKASPYITAYKYRLSSKNPKSGAIRLGLGGIFDRREETVGGFADKKQTDTTSLNGRLGFEFQQDLGDDFKWIFGADLILQNNKKRLYSDSGVDQVVDKTVGWTKGVGLVMGLRWDFTDRASIGSEMNLQFLTFQGTRDLTFSANPQFNKLISQINNSSMNFLGPANIYLSWRF